jgi:DNA-binding transcriptional ArsR family regulator
MGASKTEPYQEDEKLLAMYAKALAHPARIAILKVLLKKQACICGDIVEELPLAQSTVSQHLKELKEAGLITGEIEGVKVCYCIDSRTWEKAKTLITGFMDLCDKNGCC